MEKIYEARVFNGDTNRWDGAVHNSMRTTSLFPNKSHYAIVCPVNKTITLNKELDTHLNGGATVIISGYREGFLPGWDYANVRTSLWIVCGGGKAFRLCAYDNYQKFIARWTIVCEKRYVIVEKIKPLSVGGVGMYR